MYLFLHAYENDYWVFLTRKRALLVPLNQSVNILIFEAKWVNFTKTKNNIPIEIIYNYIFFLFFPFLFFLFSFFFFFFFIKHAFQDGTHSLHNDGTNTYNIRIQNNVDIYKVSVFNRNMEFQHRIFCVFVYSLPVEHFTFFIFNLIFNDKLNTSAL